ncbi:MAG: hypothetical protein LBV20_00010 [Treponema sp.]|jgi:hypothetical protein|nr:hypothetical protein [Treponema sp.]
MTKPHKLEYINDKVKMDAPKPSIIFIEDHAVMRKGLAAWFAASER